MAVFSESAGLCLIHIPKTGGFWAKNYLKRHVPGTNFPEDLDYPFPIGHIPLRDVEMFTGLPLSTWKKVVAVIRDPYEQQLSQFLFWLGCYKKGGRHEHDVYTWDCVERARRSGRAPLEEWLSHPGCDFHVWFEDRIGTKERAPRNETATWIMVATTVTGSQ